MASEEQIQQFIELTCEPDREKAIAYLRYANNESDRAIDAYFQGIVPPKPADDRYDERQFHSDRYDNDVGAQAPSFNIIAEEAQYSKAPSSTPTRAQSPARLALEGLAYDEGQRSGTATQQQSGVISNSGPYFGPPMQQYYDTDKWALTVAGPSVQEAEIIPDVDPQERRCNRKAGHLPFFKPLQGKPLDYLPAALTILTNTPHIANLLLLPLCDVPDYGHDPRWWTGAIIRTPQQLVAVENDETNKRELLFESQRLTAFAHGTNRSYGSVESLAELLKNEQNYMGDTAQNADDSVDLLSTYLGAFEVQSKSNEYLPGFPPRFIFGIGPPEHDLPVACLKLSFNSLERSGESSEISDISTLDDLLDERILEKDAADDEKAWVYMSPTTILTIHVKNLTHGATGLEVNIPNTLSLDRFANPSTQWRRRRAEVIRRRDALRREAVKAHELHDVKTNKTYDVLSMLSRAMKAFKDQVNDPAKESESQHTLADLEKQYARVQRSIEDLEKQHSEAIAELKALNTDPTKKPEKQKSDLTYRLAGVATKPTTTFVRQGTGRTQPKDTSNHTIPDTWVHCSYEWGGMTPNIRQEVCSNDFVHDQLKQDYSGALLIYIAEQHETEPPLDLSRALERFVKRDNDDYEVEVVEAMSYNDTQGQVGGAQNGWDDSANGLPEESQWFAKRDQRLEDETMTDATIIDSHQAATAIDERSLMSSDLAGGGKNQTNDDEMRDTEMTEMTERADGTGFFPRVASRGDTAVDDSIQHIERAH